MKKISLAVAMAALVSGTSFAREMTKELNFYGEEIRRSIDLKLEIERQYRMDLYDASLIDVEVEAKSVSSRETTVMLFAGDYESREEVLSSRYESIFLKANGRHTDGDWSLEFSGRANVRKVYVTFDTEGNGNNNGSQGKELIRYYNGKDHRITTARPSGEYREESVMGLLMDSREANSHALFECLVDNKDYMVSLDRNCEGTKYVGTLGYIHSSYAAGRVELFRCLQNGSPMNHFVSIDRGCEGHKAEGSLGFIDQY